MVNSKFPWKYLSFRCILKIDALENFADSQENLCDGVVFNPLTNNIPHHIDPVNLLGNIGR